MKIDKSGLRGSAVSLKPLAKSHIHALAEFALDPDLWRWTTSEILDRGSLEDYVAEAVAEREAGVSLPFVTVERASGRVVGCTRFGNIDRAHRRAEIGWTFIGRTWQRTVVNTEAKFLMLQWAFEEQGLLRVELKTDALNVRSRAAILRLGAQEEGTLRQHMVCANGRRRDTVYFSILDSEWPTVREGLLAKLPGSRAVRPPGSRNET